MVFNFPLFLLNHNYLDDNTQGDWERRSAENDYRKHMREEVKRSEDRAQELRKARRLQVFITIEYL